MIRNKPNVETDVLRHMLLQHLPLYKSIDAYFVRNFKKIDILHIIYSDNDYLLISLKTAKELSSKKEVAAEEFVLDANNILGTKNLNDMLRKMLQEYSSTWDAIKILDEIKSDDVGFDYMMTYKQSR